MSTATPAQRGAAQDAIDVVGEGAGSPDTSAVDFMHIIESGEPAWSARQSALAVRVDAVVRALHGLDRREIHDVLERAGRIARARAAG